jgi:hypothetical protein
MPEFPRRCDEATTDLTVGAGDLAPEANGPHRPRHSRSSRCRRACKSSVTSVSGDKVGPGEQ